MSRSNLRLVKHITAAENLVDKGIERPYQLSLFDDYLSNDIVCFSMASLHGENFLRSFLKLSPRLVLDLRKFPYFDLITLKRKDVFQTFKNHNASYFHKPLDFECVDSLSRHWGVRQRVLDIFEGFNFESQKESVSIAVLLNNRSEAEIFASAVRPVSSSSIDWKLSIL